MNNYFALTLTQMGIGKLELLVIGVVILVFPILFVYASKNLDAKGAKYPAEHNVGHMYEADECLQEFYRELDPTNTFNPGIGGTEKQSRITVS